MHWHKINSDWERKGGRENFMIGLDLVESFTNLQSKVFHWTFRKLFIRMLGTFLYQYFYSFNREHMKIYLFSIIYLNLSFINPASKNIHPARNREKRGFPAHSFKKVKFVKSMCLDFLMFLSQQNCNFMSIKLFLYKLHQVCTLLLDTFSIVKMF